MAAKIKFEFKESSHFRIVHADGVFGGPTPKGDIYASFFNERAAMPVEVSHSFDGTRVGDEILEERKVADALERTTEVAVIMSVETATHLRDWLTKNIAAIEAARNTDSIGVVKQ